MRYPIAKKVDWDTVRDELGLAYEASYEDVARRLLLKLRGGNETRPKENTMVEKMLEDLHERLLALQKQHGRSDSGTVVSVATTDVEKLRAWVQAHPESFRPLPVAEALDGAQPPPDGGYTIEG